MIEQTLRNEIEQGLLVPGVSLKQEELAARFGVSRQPIRHALERLLAVGLLRRRPDRSLAVAGLTPKEAADLIGVRTILESSALRASLPELDEVSLRRARRVYEALLDEEDPNEIEALDVQFHGLLYGRCGNDRLLQMIDELRREGRRIYARQPRGSLERTTLYEEHQAILTACEARDVEAAVQALTAHLSGTLAHITEQISEQQGE